MNIYFQDIMERIRMHYKKMTNTERIIADFFLSNTEKMEFSAKAVAACPGPPFSWTTAYPAAAPAANKH